ncbi:MAG: hypothetical protein AAF824_08505 [Bacteroidota bacterium]
MDDLGNRKLLLSARMGLWLLMLTIIILFGSISLAFMIYPIREGQESSLSVPPLFYVNTLILIISSITIHQSWKFNQFAEGKRWLWISMMLGIGFLLSQSWAWYQMQQQGMFIGGNNPRISFLYVLSLLHAAHIIGGLAFFFYALRQYGKREQNALELAMYFWHFLGVLWIYLLAVLFLQSHTLFS